MGPRGSTEAEPFLIVNLSRSRDCGALWAFSAKAAPITAAPITAAPITAAPITATSITAAPIAAAHAAAFAAASSDK